MCYLYFFFFKDTATTEIYTYWHTLSLHDALPISADSPPLLLGAANDDACCSAPTVDLLQAYRQAGASAEIHLYAAGGHAFNLGEDTPLVSLQHWPHVVLDWLSEDRKSKRLNSSH